MVKKINWVIEAKLASSELGATLLYQTESSVVDGYANFTNLTISSVGQDFTITFNFKLPVGIDAYIFEILC